ncbi:hypothetical protein DEFDS_2120 [Deferribacter desulfuricans SSM1]|uniref:Histidine kinase/HSP90-like ATPase domain-containing protein n=1 Tax=Deferribacter desulfuricans (strain DSM 14783 / JCM 11476 / NBRC 101012 / SSM1) TaxID=639282 RepID=D3PA28_DEFDS|nr:ATP-binding protein [Deferribacter desulfuricans]BAI81568.1 hypothetical protein DEFDS_2120 [Deferribacter desulfuricans SSM1]
MSGNIRKDKELDFLSEPSPDILRREIKNICDSYSHPWDILAELCQNSVDAIILYNSKFGNETGKKHEIDIAINSIERSIKIKDTGVGFSSKNFSELLSPHGTNKDAVSETIGEKGVGLTYTIFISNYYNINTVSENAHIQGHIENASFWKTGKIKELPKFKVEIWEEKNFTPLDTFTEIFIKDIEKTYSDEDDIFNMSIHVIEYILRTKTALGWLKKIFDNKDLDIRITLSLKDINGDEQKIELSPYYMLPEEFISDKDKIDLDNFKNLAATLDDRQKAKKLQGKAIIKKGALNRAGKKINFYALFVPSRGFWKDISDKAEIYIIDDLGNKKYLYEGGIYVGTKGMPTGIRIEPPITGYAGYWPNFYIILEDDTISFDLGRKSIPNRTKGLLRNIAKDLFQEFIPFIQYATSDPAVKAPTTSTIQQYKKSKIFEELEKLPDLNIDKINYLKHPDGQEASVVALFHELVASKILKGYYTLRTGYKQTYDLWGRYRINKKLIGSNFHHLAEYSDMIDLPIIIEFKYKAEDILNDFEKDIKYFTDIDLIVCWDLDTLKFSKHNVKVEPISEDDILFYGSNYKLIWPGAYNLGTASEKPVIALRKVVEDYVASL